MQEAETYCAKSTFVFLKAVSPCSSGIKTVDSVWLTVELLKYLLCYNEYFSL